MNLRNSKLLKRIQKLRRLTKVVEVETPKNCTRINCQLSNVLWESSGFSKERSDSGHDDGGGENKTSCLENNPPEELEENDNDSADEKSINLPKRNIIIKQCRRPSSPLSETRHVNGTRLIQYNNTCFHIKVKRGENVSNSGSNESMPSIRSTRGSICVASSRYVMIGKIARCLGYKLVRENKLWNILWTDTLPGVDIYKNMKRFQQINHFPGMMEICRKDLLSRNLNRMLKLYPKEYKIFPKTWIFPADYGEALNYANSTQRLKTFILKPDSGARGRGIWLTNDLKKINPTDRMICQTYIGKPLLIDGYKFDLRVYVLITSIDPLRIFVYNEGLVRFATSKYIEPSSDNNEDLFMHLTNYSVNRRNSQYDLCDNDDCGSKRKFSAINNWMRLHFYDVDEFWSRIDDIIIKTVLSSWPMLKHNYHACFPAHDKIQACFEILGFDILVDARMKPYLLEVNHSPSFHTNELVDRQVKKPLIRDTLSLVSTALADKRQILREDRNRIKQRLLKMKRGNGTQRSMAGGSTLQDSSSFRSQSSENLTSECPLSPLAQQIAWEESHLGDFRRVMPPNDPSKLNYYCQFYGQQNQASIFANTAASKKRQEVAKKLRLELEAKKRKQNEILKRHVGGIKFDERCRKRCAMPRIVVERHRQTQLKSQAQWTPDFISISEERLRLTYMEMRNVMVKDLKLIEMIFSSLFHSGTLSQTDVIKFPNLHESLKNGIDIIESTC